MNPLFESKLDIIFVLSMSHKIITIIIVIMQAHMAIQVVAVDYVPAASV